jgi:protein-S-isoprenylcysteine O-methyltransferase Ste14
LIDALARRRVTLGFGVALLALIVANPTWMTWRAGLAVAVAGEALRIWAAGHLEKSREVTRSGPYRWIRHPLYAGSVLIAAGVVVAANSLVLAIVAGTYVLATIGAAIRREEAFLRQTFGDTYDRYRADLAEPMHRRFSLARARRNREHRAVLGLAAGFALLALKLRLSI